MSARGLGSCGLAHWVLAAWITCTMGCNIGKGFQDFGNDLTKQEEVTIDGPGKRIASGRLSGMLVDPWGDDGAVIIGFRSVDNQPHLYMQPFDGSKGCDAGPAYHCIIFNRLEGAPQLIAYLTNDENGEPELNFVDHKCKHAYGGIKNAELPSRLFELPPGFVVAAGNSLLDIDPFAKTTRVITDDLRFWSGAGKSSQTTPIYYVAGGKLVVLDDKRAELLRLGKDVTEVAFEASDPNLGLFLVDEGALVRYLPTRGVPPETLERDVCEITVNTYGLSYLSPCSERRLIVRDLRSAHRDEIESDVGQVVFGQRRSTVNENEDAVDVLYTKASADPPGYADLWLKQAGAAPKLWQKRLGQFLSATLGESPSLTAIVDSDGMYGRLIYLDSSGEKTLHSRVAVDYRAELYGASILAMTDVIDNYGTLVLISRSGDVFEVAKGVSINTRPQRPETDPNLDGVEDAKYYEFSALMSNAEDGVGSLSLFSRNIPKSLTKLSDSVLVGQFEFFQNMAAIGYLDRWDIKKKSGRLVVHQTTLNADSVVANEVVDFTELLWPYEGVLYTVKSGEDYSIWSARAK